MMAQLSVPSFFSDHMVLQREKPINIWGTASAGERISVTLGNAQKSTRTDKNGKWSVTIKNSEQRRSLYHLQIF